jgi:hypothetical protein
VFKLTYFLLDISQIQIVREVRDQYVNVQHPRPVPLSKCAACSATIC